MSVRVKNEKCHFCGKSVYAMDRNAADNIVFHKGCMKCEHCKSTLSLGNFAGLNGKYYCKPHFKQLFQTKGNYSDGFGEEKPTAKWEGSTAVYASATPGANFTKPASSKLSPTPTASPKVEHTHSAEKTEPVQTQPVHNEPEPTPEPVHNEPEPEEEPETAYEPVEVPSIQVSEPEPSHEQEHEPEPDSEEPQSLSERMSSFTVSDSTPAATPASPKPVSAAPGSPGVSVRKDACNVCGKTVYAMEKMVADNVVFHKTCMKCTHCNKTLGLGNFAALNGKYYCKPHFKQLFQTKGNYSDGFGEEAPTSGWAPQAPGYAAGGPKNFFKS